MKTKKRILAYLLTLTLAMTSLPTQLFAQTTKDVPLSMTALVDTQTSLPRTIQIKQYSTQSSSINYPNTEATGCIDDSITNNLSSRKYNLNLLNNNVFTNTMDTTQNDIINAQYVKNQSLLDIVFIIQANGVDKETFILEKDSIKTFSNLIYNYFPNAQIRILETKSSTQYIDTGWIKNSTTLVEKVNDMNYTINSIDGIDCGMGYAYNDAINKINYRLNAKKFPVWVWNSSHKSTITPYTMAHMNGFYYTILGNASLHLQLEGLFFSEVKENTHNYLVDSVSNAGQAMFNYVYNKCNLLNTSRRIGYIYEQTVEIDEDVLIPQINSVKATLIDQSTNTYSLTIEDFECNSNGKAFFYWKAEEALFTSASEDFKQVECIIDKGISGRNIPITVYIGDGLGHVTSYKVWIKAN